MKRTTKLLIKNNIALRMGIVDESGLTVGDKAKIACMIERVNKKLFDTNKAGKVKYIFSRANIFHVLGLLIKGNHCKTRKEGLLLIQEYLQENDYSI